MWMLVVLCLVEVGFVYFAIPMVRWAKRVQPDHGAHIMALCMLFLADMYILAFFYPEHSSIYDFVPIAWRNAIAYGCVALSLLIGLAIQYIARQVSKHTTE